MGQDSISGVKIKKCLLLAKIGGYFEKTGKTASYWFNSAIGSPM